MGPEQPAVADPALSRGVGLYDFLKYFPTSEMLWFADSVGWSLKTQLSSVTGIFQAREQKR